MPLWLRRLVRVTWYWSARILLWGGDWRPRRMYRNERDVDLKFLDREKLFIRCKRDWLDPNNRVKAANIHFPDQSVNREKYSESYDVLLPNADTKDPGLIYWGVAVFTVCDIPPSDSTSGGTKFTFTVEHDPDSDNFGHSEMRVYKNGNREQSKNKISAEVKKAYRAKLAMKTGLVIEPAE